MAPQVLRQAGRGRSGGAAAQPVEPSQAQRRCWCDAAAGWPPAALPRAAGPATGSRPGAPAAAGPSPGQARQRLAPLGCPRQLCRQAVLLKEGVVIHGGGHQVDWLARGADGQEGRVGWEGWGRWAGKGAPSGASEPDVADAGRACEAEAG